jgi:hypothetical protein
MRSWQIVVASVVAATITDALRFLPGISLARAELTSLLLARWPAIAVVWLGSYSIVALALTTAAVITEAGRRNRGAVLEGHSAPNALPRALHHPARQYFVRLAVVQYYTSILALLGLGASRIPADAASSQFFPAVIVYSPALETAGVVTLVGLLGVVAVLGKIALLRRTPLDHTRLGPMVESPELRLLHQIVELLQARPPESAAPAAMDEAQFNALIEQGQRTILEAIKNLATSINRLSRGLRQSLQDISVTLAEGGAGRVVEVGTASPAAIEGATTELRATVAALDTSIAKLAEVASSLSTDEHPLAVQRNVPGPHPLSQLVSEFQELLREIDGPPADERPDDQPL